MTNLMQTTKGMKVSRYPAALDRGPGMISEAGSGWPLQYRALSQPTCRPAHGSGKTFFELLVEIIETHPCVASLTRKP
jgi:hypothetical protein